MISVSLERMNAFMKSIRHYGTLSTRTRNELNKVIDNALIYQPFPAHLNKVGSNPWRLETDIPGHILVNRQLTCLAKRVYKEVRL